MFSLVMASAGEHEDAHDWPVVLYASGSPAKLHAELAEKWAREWWAHYQRALAAVEFDAADYPHPQSPYDPELNHWDARDVRYRVVDVQQWTSPPAWKTPRCPKLKRHD